ncbi:branched-chain amino acid ABC transporter permease [Halorubrum ezzemoulense]|jgi:branched-subunit amino acid ABC-type transport system permease component|uniref:Branched-chain amino acid ABC transporter permease n=1 Tax=Halorubrum ezzemoulense TaxID=337243 RepID=A0A256KZR0_HALEZ|nr:branched-chain amino acid ABC transporter permease [Halorubrum ezzemoulense]MDB2239598.1 branched-chain amino acid ABC transporter permease [Halorubrum ezzemoulense]MDB2242938.1 branched-chain amino acid ABC transporter permease [Halorubrum ezzemoulense]MDB2246255.1 branched-chain amino acid ABC transporter permease [Halorubrum ezzemoulense]MDB2250006.1 branched-chain amino acid ABC transporter permease [Halorubrum ezzemoulense]MDB2262142.1 branched-chain amino acid ABC transporter permease
MGLLQEIIFGLVTGSYIAIAAIGFTLIYGIVNMINFAYGEYISIGAFIGFLAANTLPGPLPVAVVVAMIGGGVVSIILARGFFTPINHTGPVPMLLTSIGLGIVLRNGLRLAGGRSARYFETETSTFQFDAIPDLPVGPVDLLGDFFVTSEQLVVVGSAVAVFASIHLLLTRTDVGIAMRAMGDDESLARVRGIDTQLIRDSVWVLAGVLAGLAGVLMAVQTNVSADTGFSHILQILSAAILGGAGSPYGAILGAYVIGLVLAVSTAFLPSSMTGLSSAVAFVILIAVLLVKPSGIAGTEVREA